MIWQTVPLKELLTQDVQNGYSPVCQEAFSGREVLSLGALKLRGACAWLFQQ